MKSDYINVDTNKQKSPVLARTGSALLSILTGIGDWIGLGAPIRSLVEDNSGRYQNLKKARTMLTNRINELLSKKAINIQKLEDKLHQLENAGFALTGVALKRYSEEVDRVRKDVQRGQSEYEQDKLNLTKAQADVDSLNAEATDLDNVDKQLNAANEIETQLNHIYKGE